MNTYEAITSRVSTRKYADQPIAADMLRAIQEGMKSYQSMEGSPSYRLELLTEPETVKNTGIGFFGGRLGVNAPYCVVGITQKAQGGMANIGFLLEQFVLDLTAQGLSTCWLATYNRKSIEEICHVQENEAVAIVIAFGYKATEKSFRNDGMRKIVGSTKRKPVEEIFYQSQWGNSVKQSTIEPKLLYKITEMSVLAPSARNVQPVRVILDGHNALFFVKTGMEIDAGIFIAHFWLSCLAEKLAPSAKVECQETENYHAPEEYTYVYTITF